jgi:plasmid stabilization system protein ParE
VSLPVVLRAEAQAEFDEAFDWYEARRPGLGVDFAECVQEAFDRISANPQINGVVFQDVREGVVRHFSLLRVLPGRGVAGVGPRRVSQQTRPEHLAIASLTRGC